MNMFRYEAMLGDHIVKVIEEMIKIAEARRPCEVVATFNDIDLKVVSTSAGCTTFEEAMAQFREGMDKAVAEGAAQQAIEDAKPENIERRRLETEKRAAQEAELAAEGGALCAFTFASVEAEGVWNHLVDVNKGDYGACTIRFAARWAHKMEARIAAGEKLEDIAKASSHDADIEGITGFMYGWAVAQIARVWVHGETLRRWHNLDTQIGNEGEKANESGGSLNPALLHVGAC